MRGERGRIDRASEGANPRNLLFVMFTPSAASSHPKLCNIGPPTYACPYPAVHEDLQSYLWYLRVALRNIMGVLAGRRDYSSLYPWFGTYKIRLRVRVRAQQLLQHTFSTSVLATTGPNLLNHRSAAVAIGVSTAVDR